MERKYPEHLRSGECIIDDDSSLSGRHQLTSFAIKDANSGIAWAYQEMFFFLFFITFSFMIIEVKSSDYTTNSKT